MIHELADMIIWDHYILYYSSSHMHVPNPHFH